jgi:hypothetical protein
MKYRIETAGGFVCAEGLSYNEAQEFVTEMLKGSREAGYYIRGPGYSAFRSNAVKSPLDGVWGPFLPGGG